MNYLKHYNLLMERAPKTRPKSIYTERHRILPGCMGGKYVIENIAYLTPEEHYLAHQLLVKIYPEQHKLAQAMHMLTVSINYHSRNNKEYGWVKRRYSKAVSIQKTGQIPWNKGKPMSDTQKLLISQKMTGTRKAWNIGLPNPKAANNGKKGAVKLSAKATGRKRFYKPDGSWTWIYPN